MFIEYETSELFLYLVYIEIIKNLIITDLKPEKN